MKLEDIFEHWDKDSKIDSSELGSEALKIPTLHNKYLKMLAIERVNFKRMTADHDRLYQIRCDWWTGKLPPEDLKHFGWEPNPLRVMADDLKYRMKADKEMIKSSLRMSEQEEIIDTLISILQSINNRNYNITNAINWLKFTNGS